jgi:hypothetical protein
MLPHLPTPPTISLPIPTLQHHVYSRLYYCSTWPRSEVHPDLYSLTSCDIWNLTHGCSMPAVINSDTAGRPTLVAEGTSRGNFCCTYFEGGGGLTLTLLMSYIYGAPCKDRNFNVVYMKLRTATLKAVSFYLLHNVSALNQCRKLSCVTVVCKQFASYQGYPNYRWDF